MLQKIFSKKSHAKDSRLSVDFGSILEIRERCSRIHQPKYFLSQDADEFWQIAAFEKLERGNRPEKNELPRSADNDKSVDCRIIRGHYSEPPYLFIDVAGVTCTLGSSRVNLLVFLYAFACRQLYFKTHKPEACSAPRAILA